jgi:acetyl esterase
MECMMTDFESFDPRLFRTGSITLETAAFITELEALIARETPIIEQTPQAARAARESGRSRSGPVVLSNMATERTIKGPAGDITLRVFVPDTVKGVYLHIHGGGFVTGRAHLQDSRLENIALIDKLNRSHTMKVWQDEDSS